MVAVIDDEINRERGKMRLTAHWPIFPQLYASSLRGTLFCKSILAQALVECLQSIISWTEVSLV